MIVQSELEWIVPGAESAPATVACSVILPAWNEEAALPSVLGELQKVLDDRCEVIVVDDASTDRTSAVAGAFPCRVIRHPVNRGKGAAVRTGLLAARGDFVIVMDADNTYPASIIPEMLQLSAEYDFVRCIRVQGLTNSPLLNRLGNKIFDTALVLLHGLEGGDHLTGLYGLKRETMTAMKIRADRFDLEVEIGIKSRAMGLRAICLPIAYQPRIGEKKLSPWRDGFQILSRAVAMRLA